MTITTPHRVVAAVLATATLTIATPLTATPVAGAAPSTRTVAPSVSSAAPSWPLMADRDPLAAVAASAYRALAWSIQWGDGAHALQYEVLREEVATEVARRLELDSGLLVERWSTATVERQLALFAGLSQLGVPYRSISSRPGVGFDCSGFTSYAWGMAGRDLPRISRDQMRAGSPRDAFTVQPADLVYFPGHVMLSLGLPGAVVHSPQSGRTVEVQVFDRNLTYADPTT